MGEVESFAVASLLSIVGGAIGARLAKAEAWKGCIVGLAGLMGAALVAIAGVMDPFPLVVAFLITAGLVGGAAKLSGRQPTNAGLGAIRSTAIGFVPLR